MKTIKIHILLFFLCACLFPSCSGSRIGPADGSCGYARYFDILDGNRIVAIDPWSGRRDTVAFSEPASKIICMSSGHVACLSAIGADSIICAVSGVRYISDTSIVQRHKRTAAGGAMCGNESLRPLYDIGYDNSLDYELVLSLAPDLVIAYSISGAEPQYVSKLRSLGVPVLLLHDYREQHPLARAEYIRLFGVVAGRREAADSVFSRVRDRYVSLAVPDSCKRVNVLINAPYSDAWYVPGTGNYMAKLVYDAGGMILGAEKGLIGSGIISLEQAYELSGRADFWLNPGHCRSRTELASVHQLFPFFGPLAEGRPIYNNTLMVNSEGGNDFWESGAVRPDLILEDLLNIFSGNPDAPLHYFVALD